MDTKPLRNIEIKAKATDFDKQIQIAKKLSGQEAKVIIQEDTFFFTPKGRLKLRVIPGTDQKAMLIYYERPDSSGPKLSSFYVNYISEPQLLKETLSKALGVKGCIKKQRLLFLVGQTRVHLDTVEGLGHFLELEVVLQPDQDEKEGVKIAHELKNKLEVRDEDLVEGAYLDLLVDKN
eukprot:TRINITY_DN4430_c0_g1_i1.p1 TRINITY_DN4430_c0_g1~~TRINITY_DN4430_c0_g1_i1.p1  ORF type:complete len:190 (+),score=32.77 TRINITY_DN4430_c0_g1_i1:37-570(+)